MPSRNLPATTLQDASGNPTYDASGYLLGASGERVGSVTTGSTYGIIAPFIAQLNVDASGELKVLETQTVSISNIDEAFEVDLSGSEAVKILNAFRIKDRDASGSDASGSADIEVVMDASGDYGKDFKETLAAALLKVDLVNSSSKSLTDWLKAEARADTLLMLSYDTLANLLEASDLDTFGIDIDASGGSNDLYSKMNADTESASNRREALFRQIPKSDVQAYLTVSDGSSASMEGVTNLGFLPLLKDGKITFVFDCTVGEYIMGSGVAPTSAAKVYASQDTVSAGTGTTNAYNPSSVITVTNNGKITSDPLVFTAPTRRRVAVTLKMTAADTGAFDVDATRPLEGTNGPAKLTA